MRSGLVSLKDRESVREREAQTTYDFLRGDHTTEQGRDREDVR